jgi:ion channel-forming bestrophin family protein
MSRWMRRLWPPLPVWRRLDAAVIAVVAYFVFVGFVFEVTNLQMPKWGGVLTLLNAVVLGVLLQFRNRESYDRWWEARKLWGQLVNDSRNLSVKIDALPKLEPGDKAEAGRLILGFAVALKNHLRMPPGAALPTMVAGKAMPAHIPLDYARRTTTLVRGWRDAGKLTDFDMLLLDPHVRGQSDVMGACERIKNTPLPLSYRSLLKHGLVLYLLTCPWLIFEEIHWWGLPAIGLLAYFLLGIEFTAEDVEEPFGRDADDLALNTYCETIWKSVREVLSTDLAAPAPTVDVRMP